MGQEHQCRKGGSRGRRNGEICQSCTQRNQWFTAKGTEERMRAGRKPRFLSQVTVDDGDIL